MKNTSKLLMSFLAVMLCIGVYAYAGSQNSSLFDTVIGLQQAMPIMVMSATASKQPIGSGPVQVAAGNNSPNMGSANGSASTVYLRPAVPSAKVTVQSNPDAAAVETQIYIWNQDYLKNTLTNTGVALVYNFEDAFNGDLTSHKIAGLDGGPPATLHGLYIRALADGIADPTGLSNTEPSILKYTGRSDNAIPNELYIDDNETRADQDDSIGVVRIPGGIPWDRSTQFTCKINGDDTVVYTLVIKFYFFPNFKV